MKTEQNEVTATQPEQTEQAAPSLTESQLARVAEKLKGIARGVATAAPLTMARESPHSSHSDNDGWI